MVTLIHLHIRTHMYMYIDMYVYIAIYGQASGVPSPPPPWYGLVRGGGGGWRVRRGVGAVGTAAGETARRHRQGRHSTQALRKP